MGCYLWVRVSPPFSDLQLVQELIQPVATMTGPFITALEEAAGLTAEIVGKPTRAFFEMTLKSLERDGIFAEDWACVAMVRSSWIRRPCGIETDV